VAGTPRRNFGLDLLRVAAILVVLANHAWRGFFVDTGLEKWGGTGTGLSVASVFSVEWLFVLSGFLIGTMMIRSFERGGSFRERLRSFWLRRWFRTVPNYYLFLAANAALVAAGISSGAFRWRFAVFSQGLLWWPDFTFFFSEAWSLAIDEWFYLVMPLLVSLFLLGRKPTPRAFWLATLALIVVPVVARLLADPPSVHDGVDRLQDWDVRFRRGVLFHLDATGWGVLGAVTSRWRPAFWQRRKGTKALVGLACTLVGVVLTVELFFVADPVLHFPRLSNAASLTAMGVGAFLMLPWVAALPAWGGWAGAAVDRISLLLLGLPRARPAQPRARALPARSVALVDRGVGHGPPLARRRRGPLRARLPLLREADLRPARALHPQGGRQPLRGVSSPALPARAPTSLKATPQVAPAWTRRAPGGPSGRRAGAAPIGPSSAPRPLSCCCAGATGHGT
jgi:peptidoglycan/LPS O-acetylase OafA/YrhL